MKTKLKPCPFCGEKIYLDLGGTEVWWVTCENPKCGTEGPSRWTKQLAADAWNRRVKESDGER